MLSRMLEWKKSVDVVYCLSIITMILFCMITVSVVVHAQVLGWSVKAIREALLKCDAEVQSKILQKGVELLFDTTSHPSEEEMDWSIALVASVIVALRPSATVPNKQTLLSTLMRAAQSEKPFLVTETAALAVASMLNKWASASTDEVG